MMKININHTIIAFCALIGATSCSDLDVSPSGGTMTDDQKKEVIAGNPARLQSEVNGLYSGLYKEGSITDWSGNVESHFDFGFAAACMMYDASGMDEPAENSGYNWFGNQLSLRDRVSTSSSVGRPTYFLWNTFYSEIKTANNILATVSDTTTNATLQGYLGQALAARAFSYLNLIQIYQQTYKGHEKDLGVPIVLETTTPAQAANNPRATVQDVYDLIISDLTKSIGLLKSFARPSKEVINAQVAYGLRARAYLNMEEWAKAADDAAKALVGYTPQSISDVSKPSFNNISAGSWIWGIKVSETADVVTSGIVNFPSHMCSFTGNGYAPGYTGRYINSSLWNQIPSSDIRKGWWLDGNYNSPNVDWTWSIVSNGKVYGVSDWFGFNAPYLNVKFGAYKDIYNNPTNACDFPLIRAEEMILVRAEGLAMSGNTSDAKTLLESFVQTYRNPSYVCPASSSTGIQDEIWFQRRIELWGEGFSLFDMKRLNKPMDRKGTNYAAALQFTLPAAAPILLWIIPEAEANYNKGIVNNPMVTVPVP